MFKCFYVVFLMNGTLIGDERILTQDENITTLLEASNFTAVHGSEFTGDLANITEENVDGKAYGCYDMRSGQRIVYHLAISNEQVGVLYENIDSKFSE